VAGVAAAILALAVARFTEAAAIDPRHAAARRLRELANGDS
jgi:hypothetical protein